MTEKFVKMTSKEQKTKTEDNFEDISHRLEGSSESYERKHRDDYFLSDPAAWWDALPQPFIMIDKIVTYLLEQMWSAIEQRERVKRSQRIARSDSAVCATPTVYGPNGILSQVTSISSAGYCDGQPYIAFGTTNGLYMINGISQTVCANWQGLNTEILETHLYYTPQKTFLITTVDDLSDARVFLFIEPDVLQLVYTFNEKFDGDVKPLISTCAASSNGEYLAVTIDPTPNKKGRYIMVYSIPFDQWDTKLRANSPTRQELRQPSPAEPSEDIHSTSVLTDLKEEEFQKPNLILKIPALEIGPGNPGKNLQHICKSVDVSGEVIGIGYNNIITQNHLDLRKAVLEYLHEDLKKYPKHLETTQSEKWKEYSENLLGNPPKHIMIDELNEVIKQYKNNGIIYVSIVYDQSLKFQFIKPSDLHSVCDGEQRVNGLGILVWCSDNHILSLYSLGKHRKEGSFLEPERVWPFSAGITAVAVSRFSSLLAIGLENGCVALWDVYFGIMRGVHYLGGPSSVRQLHFIYSDKHQDPAENGYFACNIIATLSNGITQRLTSSASEPLTAVTILPEAHSDDILVMHLIPIPGKSELVLITFSSGVVVLVDVFEGETLCELQLSSGYHLSSSWAPVISVVTEQMSSYAYIVGTSETTPGCCFYFHLNELPVLNSYWSVLSNIRSFVVPISLEHQQNDFLNERKNEQKDRNGRLRVRWKELINHLPTSVEDVEQVEVAAG